MRRSGTATRPGIGPMGSICTVAAAGLLAAPAPAATWRVGDVDQPWLLFPVSSELDVSSERFRPDFVWGGPYAVEIVVDDDGDGRIDEDPVDLVDDDGDGFYNEDGPDGVDNDRDGRVDEDGADRQLDNDGDGLLNEDGRMTGGVIFDPGLREAAPYGTRERPGEYGDDDLDASVNEDPVNGRDDDGDGLVDEDDRAPGMPPGGTWRRPVFAYDGSRVADPRARRDLAFEFDAAAGVYVAAAAPGDTVVAAVVEAELTPSDWLRPIRLDSMRNLARLVDDRFLAGELGSADPFSIVRYVSIYHAANVRLGDVGSAFALDGNVHTARILAAHKQDFNMELRGLFLVDRLRMMPRPDFPDRVVDDFRVRYAGDEDLLPVHTRGGIEWTLNPQKFLVPEQKDQREPAVKDFRLDGGELGPPRRAYVVTVEPQLADLEFSAGLVESAWEMAEVELYGRGHALDASYVTEIIDVGSPRVRYRRYFDPEDPGRPVTFERLLDIDPAAADRQFDPGLEGRPVTWGTVGWRCQVQGEGARLAVRVRTGASLDAYLYQREVAPGVYSEFTDTGRRIGAAAYLAMRDEERVPVPALPANGLGRREEGDLAGWTPWSAPLDFDSGLLDEHGAGGVAIPVSALTRYIQFRLDFGGGEKGAVSVDHLRLSFGEPLVAHGVLAEIYPDRARLGEPVQFRYVLRPAFGSGPGEGFNRIDIAVPSLDVEVDSVVVDGLIWTRAAADGSGGPSWLDALMLEEEGLFAATVYEDEADRPILALKTSRQVPQAFQLGERIEVYFRTAPYRLFTEFRSWVRDDADPAQLRTAQPTEPGDASPELASDGVGVVVMEQPPSMLAVAAEPNPFTPNGDGRNDVTAIGLELFLLREAAEVRVEIRTLDGGLVRSLGPFAATAGRSSVAWDGLDSEGLRVPPGVYLYRAALRAATARQERLGVIGVAY